MRESTRSAGVSPACCGGLMFSVVFPLQPEMSRFC